MVQESTLGLICATLLLLATTPVVLAHGHDDHVAESTKMGPVPVPLSAAIMNSSSASPQSYFTYPALGGLMLGHIILMTIAWIVFLPICKYISKAATILTTPNRCVVGVMLSVARSWLALPAQLSFLGLHSVGLLLGALYSFKTPDLYENNAHNKIGWIITWIIVAQCIIGLVKLAFNFKKHHDGYAEEQSSFLPITIEALAQHHQEAYLPDEYRYSRDSGHFTASENSRSQSISSMHDQESEEHQKFLEYQNRHADTDPEYAEKQGFLGSTKAQSVATCIAALISQRTMRALSFAYHAIDCVSMLFGFAAIVSGAAVYGGVFVSYDQDFHRRHRQS